MGLTYNFANKRYNSIFKRSFNISVDLFFLKLIFEKAESKYLDEKGTLGDFGEFLSSMNANPDIEKYLMKKYKRFYQCKKDNDLIQTNGDITFKQANALIVDAIRTHPIHSFQPRFEEIFFMKIEKFQLFYQNDEYNRKCTYCGISESQIKQLFRAEQINTKRWATRGEKMEIDRLRPEEQYKLGNLGLCCYWCNNAKTDEFSYNEFIPIGKSLRILWNNRLKGITNEFIPLLP